MRRIWEALQSISGAMPHPDGMIAVDYKKNNNKWLIKVLLPKTVT
ncbi:hypothetical protein [Hydrotalea sp.]|nr:hypothetical protein [Hydrotalea sp.]